MWSPWEGLAGTDLLGSRGSSATQHSRVNGEKNLTMAGSRLKVSFPQGSHPSSYW